MSAQSLQNSLGHATDMRAAYITCIGDTTCVQEGQLPVPQRKVGETLIRTTTVGLNWLDILLRTEDFGLSSPIIPGSDICGVVQETDSDRVKVGDLVVVNPAIPCGKCFGEADDPNACRFVKILGVGSDGGYGEFVCVPSSQVYPAPSSLSAAEAAAFPLDYLTAWRMLVTKAQLRAGETVLIWGASGSLGAAAVRIAKYLNARVLAVCSSESMEPNLRGIGADHVINRISEDVVAKVKQLTDGNGADCVFESIGHDTMNSSMNAVRPHGRIVICGTRSGTSAELNLEDLYYNQIEIRGSRMGSQREFEEVLSRMDDPRLRPVVAMQFSLRDVRLAHNALEKRSEVGKIVLHHD